MKRKDMERWLRRNGFDEVPDKAGGHRHFVKQGVKVSIRHHGPTELSTEHLSMIARNLERAGLYKASDLRREWGMR